MGRLSRRQALQLMAAASASLAVRDAIALTAASDDGWHQGDLVHLLPLVNHRQMLIKASFGSAQLPPPHLHLDGRRIAGVKSDTRGRFWQFHVSELASNHTYKLQLRDSAGATLTDPWPLKTFPAPDAPVEHLRILAYTCAGGNEALGLAEGMAAFLPITTRQRLLERGLSFSPDVVIANGDHIYWDQATSQNKPAAFAEPARRLYEQYGYLSRDKPALHPDNEAILTAIVDPQIAQLYGVRLRSVPVYMLTDDHDLFENDEASDDLITLPPDQHMLDAARSTQQLYYPEYLPDATRSPGWRAVPRRTGPKGYPRSMAHSATVSCWRRCSTTPNATAPSRGPPPRLFPRRPSNGCVSEPPVRRLIT